jgi:hypothetical protein
MRAPAAAPQHPVVTRLVRAGRDRPYSPGALELTPARFLFRPTGVAAVGAVLLNVLYITGGSAGPNGVFIALGVLLAAACRVAGYLGADYAIRPAISTRWSRRGQSSSRSES